MVVQIMSGTGMIGRLERLVAPMYGVARVVDLSLMGTALASVVIRARASDRTSPDAMTGQLRLPVGSVLVGDRTTMVDLLV